MAGPKVKGKKNEKQNKIYSGGKDWTWDVYNKPHKEYKKGWDKFMKGVKSLPSKRAANVKVGEMK